MSKSVLTMVRKKKTQRGQEEETLTGTGLKREPVLVYMICD